MLTRPNSEYPGVGGQKQVLLTCGVDATTLTFDPLGTSVNEWETFHFTFVATSTVTPITITGLQASGIYLAVDNVSVGREETDLKILEVRRLEGQLRIRFAAARGRHYVLDARADLMLGSWREVPGSSIAGDDGLLEIAVPSRLDEAQQFYRVRANPGAER